MNKEMLTNKIRENMNLCSANAHLIAVLYPYLESWEGKMVSKRLINHITSNIDTDYHVYLRKGFECIELSIRRGTRAIEYIRLCDLNDKKFRMSYFKEKNSYLFKYQEQYDKYLEASRHIDEWYEKYSLIKEDVKKLKKEVEESGCSYVIDWDFRFTD